MWAVEVILDAAAEARVRSAWASLDARGVVSLGAVPGTAHRPHVSLAVFEAQADATLLSSALAPASGSCAGMPLLLASLGFFGGPGSVVFLGVTPTRRLLDAHRQVHDAVADLATDSWRHYEPGRFVPHCTLAIGVDEVEGIASVHAALSGFPLPIEAAAAEVHLVDVATGRSRARLA